MLLKIYNIITYIIIYDNIILKNMCIHNINDNHSIYYYTGEHRWKRALYENK